MAARTSRPLLALRHAVLVAVSADSITASAPS